VKFKFCDLFTHAHEVLDEPAESLMGAQLLAQQGQTISVRHVAATGLALDLGGDEEVGAVELGRLGLAAAEGFAADIEPFVQTAAPQGLDLGEAGEELTAFSFERLVSGHEGPPFHNVFAP
jgi:hypothetical protein